MATKTETGPMFTELEAAAYLKLSPGTLRTWRCTQEQIIPFYRLGSAVRYRQSDLDKWLASRYVKQGK